jgi:hypothetical protein
VASDLTLASAPPRDDRGRLTSLPPALAANVWKPGQSGNPGGKGGDFKALQAYCREKSLASAERIWKIAETSKDERLAFHGVHVAVERGCWGKAKDFDPKNEAPAKPKFDPRLLSRNSWKSYSMPCA